MAEDHNAVRVFWASLDSAWRDSGAQPAEEISSRLQRDRNYSLAASTIRGWLEHNGLPRKDDDFTEMCLLLVGNDRARELVALLRRARRPIRSPAGPPPPDPPPPPDDNRGPRSSLRAWHAAALVALVVLGVAAALVLPPDDEDAGSSPVESSGTAVSGTSPDDPPCPTPTVQAASRNAKRAHATFCADRAEFLLYDDSPDDKSAVLVARVGGQEWPAWFNSSRHATRSPDGSQVMKNPPQRILVSFPPDDTAEFRVCLGDRNPERTYLEDTCGDWTPIRPPR